MKRVQSIQSRAQRRTHGRQVAHEPHQILRPYLTPREAVAYLKLGSLSALYRLIREHRLPFGRVGRQYRFRQEQLDRWVEVRGVESPVTVVRSA